MSNSHNEKPKALVLAVFIILAAIVRLVLVDVPNISPVAAMALFGGAYFHNKRMAFLLPVFVMFLSDVLIELVYQMGWRQFGGIHNSMIFVYAAFLAVVAIGTFLKNRVKPLPLVGAGLLSSIVFFFITNFGVWAAGDYAQNFSGLVECFTLAIPFFKYTFVGDLFFVVLLFGCYEWAKNRYPKLVTVNS